MHPKPSDEDLEQRLKTLEKELGQSRKLLDTILNCIPDGIFVKDESHRWVILNDATCKSIGHPRETLIGKTDYEFHTKEESDIFWAHDDLVFASGKPDVNEERVVNTDRNPRIISTSKSMFTDDTGNRFIVGIVHDITERRQAEAHLQNEINRRRLLVEQSMDGIIVLDETGGVVDVNQKFADTLGYSINEVFLLHVWDWDAHFSREELLEMIAKNDASGIYVKTLHRRKDGTVLDTEISATGTVYNGEKLIFCICRDVTARNREQREREALITELQNALAEINTLRGILPICSSCKKIRDDQGYWNQIETYIRKHSMAQFSHGICPDCARKLYPDFPIAPRPKPGER